MSPPRRRPPWWPEGEEWPPRHRRRGGPPPFFAIGCFLLFVVVLVTGVVSLVSFAVAGVTQAPVALVVVGLLVGLLVLVGLRGIRRFSAPLDELAAAAESIERGEYSARVAVRGPAAVRSLARTFNEMSERLAAVDEDRRAFLADAAHELRTPLSIIAGQIEAIEDGLYPADAAHLAPIHEQLRLLEQLIEDMRTVALAQAGALQLNLQPTDLGASIDHAVAAFGARASAAGVELGTDYPPGLPKATADEQRVGQVLANLLSNALRYTPRAGHVVVAARVTGSGELEMTVRDDGPGIPAELLPRIFDRFAKGSGSTGSGLGLAICRDLVEAMGGTISVDSAPGRGTAVNFVLPRA